MVTDGQLTFPLLAMWTTVCAVDAVVLLAGLTTGATTNFMLIKVIILGGLMALIAVVLYPHALKENQRRQQALAPVNQSDTGEQERNAPLSESGEIHPSSPAKTS